MTVKKLRGTLLTPRQWQIVHLRATGLTQREVAKRLHTSRENIGIIEHRAYGNIKAAKATLAALQEVSDPKEVLCPAGTSIFEVTSRGSVSKAFCFLRSFGECKTSVHDASCGRSLKNVQVCELFFGNTRGEQF